MKRLVWVLVAVAVLIVIGLMVRAPSGELRTSDPRTLGGPPAGSQ